MTEFFQLPTIKLGAPGEEISKKELIAVIQRFKNLHRLQQQRIQSFLHPRQHVFLNILPLLFHRNAPLLPGFITTEVPAGIADYSPGRQTLREAAVFSKGFSFRNKALNNYPIWGLFLMGSVSSIAFSKTSDMDIWLCHQPGLTPDQISLLQQKATAVEAWAASLDLEVHFFLIDSEQFKDGEDTPISSESSGKTQHYLLLEEFYRTAVYIAGRAPAWWLVPPEEEQNHTQYINHLIKFRFISEHELIDFGSLSEVPPEEFLTATLWHLYKAINSPHKSLLKLLLMECYASEYPRVEWLCLDLKKFIYDGYFSLDDLDPYLLIYQKLESYLTKAGSKNRLELARQSFYFKIMGFSGVETDSRKKHSRIDFLTAISQRWKWPSDLLRDLMAYKSWNIVKVSHEHALIIMHLSECYRMITGFASKHVQDRYKDNEDMKLIGRKLFSFLEKKPGKIEFLSTRSYLKTQEHELSLVESSFADNYSGWSLFIERVNADNHQNHTAIKNSWSLVEILAWIIVNGLYHKKLHLNLDSKTVIISDKELRSMFEQIYFFINSHLHQQYHSLDNYKHPNKPTASLLLINIGDLPESAREDGMLIMSERSDPFSYGINRKCFIHTIDRLTISSWGELSCRRALGLEGLFDIFVEIINSNAPNIQIAKNLSIASITSVRANSITQRAQQIFQNLLSIFAPPKPGCSPRYILSGGSNFYIFQLKNTSLHYWLVPSQSEVINELSKPHGIFSPVYIDKNTLNDNIISDLYAFNKENSIQIFFSITKKMIHLYILDEKGSLFCQQHALTKVDVLLNRYRDYFENSINRYFFDARITFEFYEIENHPVNIRQYNPTQMSLVEIDKELNLRVSAEQINGVLCYTLFCNEKEFTSLEYGNDAMNAAARYILQFRKSRQSYPIYVSDIDIPLTFLSVDDEKELQMIHLLKYKQKIETKLNSATNSTPSTKPDLT